MSKRVLWLASLMLLTLALACDQDDDDDSAEPLPPPGDFQAGFAQVNIPVPLGMGTCGNGALGEDPNPSPFADKYPATTRVHASLTFKAVALSRGDYYEAVFVRSDTIGVFQHLREAVINELENRLGKNMDDSLIIGGNHTHSGPGRMVNYEGVITLLTDTFWPEYYENIVDALADVVEQALDDMAPAEVGHVIASTHDAHQDRRCANDALDLLQENPALPIIAVQREGQLEALVMSYGYHGTVIGISDLTQSPDMGGIAEQKIAEYFDHPVHVLLFNAWGGDMRHGPSHIPEDAVGAIQPDGFDQLESIGVTLGDALVPTLDTIVYTDEPDILTATYRFKHDREAIGYGPSEFPYEWGGVYCSGAENCEDDTPVPGIDQACVPVPESEPLPGQTVVTVGQIEGLYFTTASGEWSTSLADKLLQDIMSTAGTDEAMFFGYTQDYTGYSLLEVDWWQGGYATSGGLWGPRQGDHLADRTAEAFQNFYDPSVALPFEQPAPMEEFGGYTIDPYIVEEGVGVGTLAIDVAATVGPTDVVTFTVQGTDPWLGNPVATLEQDTGSGFAPVLRPNGTAVTSDGYELWIDLTTDPTYTDEMPADQRTFYWAFSFPVTHRVPSSVTDLSGEFRFTVTIPVDGNGGSTEATTGTFIVE